MDWSFPLLGDRLVALQWLSRAYLYDEQKKKKKNEIEDCMQSASAYYRKTNLKRLQEAPLLSTQWGDAFGHRLLWHLLLQLCNLTYRVIEYVEVRLILVRLGDTI